MIPIAAPVLFGTLLALAIIYWLWPLNGGAITLVVILCVGAARVVARLLSRKKKNGGASGDKAKGGAA